MYVLTPHAQLLRYTADDDDTRASIERALAEALAVTARVNRFRSENECAQRLVELRAMFVDAPPADMLDAKVAILSDVCVCVSMT
jgi:hypothetical protein